MSLDADTTLTDMACGLLYACEEAKKEGVMPNFDVAVIVLASRIAFACSAEAITPDMLQYFISVLQEGDAATLALKPSIKQ